jgi:L-seryl-tRNA(Ser) seleniumtransferase
MGLDEAAEPGLRRARALRELPSVDRLAVSVSRAALADRRAQLLAGGAVEGVDLTAQALDRLRPSLRPVINATGVIIHTNLGRAPLARGARAALARAAKGYTNLEFGLADGQRGARHRHVEDLLRELTGANAAFVVNNCAAAVLLAVASLAGAEGEIVVSRGQLIEIGGEFRIPEIVAQGGARLVEVGTTNRTRPADYAAALGPRTAAILRAHPSNFRTLGFTEEVGIEVLCELGVPVIDDIGSGVLADGLALLDDEPAVRRSLRAGAAIVCFSGDKLLGGPQAGIMLGHEKAIAAARRHPLARALRIDKLSLAALEATLALYRDPQLAAREIPVLAMLSCDPASLAARARELAEATGGEVVASTARVGPAVAVDDDRGADWLSRVLRHGDPPVIARIADDCVLLDPRTLTDEQVRPAAAAVQAARR